MKYLADKSRPSGCRKNLRWPWAPHSTPIASRLFTPPYSGPGLTRNSSWHVIFESQVEPQCRDFAFEAGKHVFECYVFSGAYDELLSLLKQSIEPPRFEFKVTGTIGGIPSWASLTAVSCWTLAGPYQRGLRLEGTWLLQQVWCQPDQGLPAVPRRLRDGQAEPLAHDGSQELPGHGLPGHGDQFGLHGVLQQGVQRPAMPLRLAAGRAGRRRECSPGLWTRLWPSSWARATSRCSAWPIISVA